MMFRPDGDFTLPGKIAAWAGLWLAGMAVAAGLAVYCGFTFKLVYVAFLWGWHLL